MDVKDVNHIDVDVKIDDVVNAEIIEVVSVAAMT